MKSVAICEKPSQARNVQAALGPQFHKVIALQGHVFRLMEPDEVNPAWAGAWRDQGSPLLWAGKPYSWVPDDGDGKGPRLAQLKAALKEADVVYIACDDDREGQLIGEIPLRELGWRGPVKRMLFNKEDRTALEKAYREARDNVEFRRRFDAGNARHQADQVYGMTLTRAVTMAFNSPYSKQALGIGRVKTPTVKIVVQRELEIRNFRKTVFYVVEIEVKPEGRGETISLVHAPDEQHRILDKAVADRLAAAAMGCKGPLRVKTERKSSRPKGLLDQGAIQKKAGSWGWSVDKTARVLQQLYQDHHLLTYPGTDGRYLPDDHADYVPAMLQGLASLGFGPIPQTPVIRTGKTGHFWSEGLEDKPHYAIVPDADTLTGVNGENFKASYAGLDSDQKRLFDYVARLYIAAVSPDFEYSSTTITLDLDLEGRVRQFATSGTVPITPGWRAVMRDEERDEEEDDADRAALPPVADGQSAQVGSAAAGQRETRPKGRFTDGALVEAMRYCWRDIPPGPERDRLEESEGIGRPRTRPPTVIELLKQGQLVKQGKYVVPSEDAIQLITLLDQVAPEMTHPGLTARWEMRLDAIERGEASATDVIAEIVADTERLLKVVKANAGRMVFKGPPRKPTKPMLDAVNNITKKKNIKPSREVFRDFDTCRAWLDQHAEKRDPSAGPSEAQVSFAKTIAAATGAKIPDGAMQDAAQLKSWIDANKSKLPPNDRQLKYAEELAAKSGRALTDAERGSAAKLSAAIDSMKKSLGRGTGGNAPARSAAKRRKRA